MDNETSYIRTKPVARGMSFDEHTIALVTLSSVLFVALLVVIGCLLRIKFFGKPNRGSLRPSTQSIEEADQQTHHTRNPRHQRHNHLERTSVHAHRPGRRLDPLENQAPNIFVIPRPRYRTNNHQTRADSSFLSIQQDHQTRSDSSFSSRHHAAGGGSVFYPRNTSVFNPVYSEDDEVSSNIIPSFLLRDLYVVTERSSTKEVCNKQVVSLCHEVDYKGDLLILDNMGISLKVPKGAVKRGEKKLIALLLNWDLSDNPNMDNTESLVSPVVYVGPHNLKLEKPCVLSFRHCAFDTRQIKVLRSETDIAGGKDWKAMCEHDGRSDSCYLTADECQLTIDSFTLYTCIQTPHEDNPGKKWLQIAVFACPLRWNRDHHQIRVYFLNKTNCALQWAIQREQEFGGKLVCPEHVFLFDGNDLAMLTVTKYISEGWEVIDKSENKVPFLNIWHGKCPFVPICYKKTGSVERSGIRQNYVAIEMNLCIETYQDTMQSSAHKIIAQVYEDDVTPDAPSSPATCQHPDIFIKIDNSGRTDTSGYQSNGIQSIPTDSNQTERSQIRNEENSQIRNEKRSQINIEIINDPKRDPFGNPAVDSINWPPKNIPYKVRNHLILLLDPKMSLGYCSNDWRDLATALGIGDCIAYLDNGKESPTAELLDIIECRNMSLNDLRVILEDIERPDCVKVIDDYSQKTQRRNASEHCLDDNDEYYRGDCLETQESSWTTSACVGNGTTSAYVRNEETSAYLPNKTTGANVGNGRNTMNIVGPESRTHPVQNDYYDRERRDLQTITKLNNL